MKTGRKTRLLANIAIHTEIGELLTEQRIRLLEAIERYGSLTSAARQLPLSYKAAWDAVEQMNRLAEFPLVQCKVGGRNGGGTMLTEEGQRLLAVYRAIEDQCRKAIAELDHYMTAGTNPVHFRYLLNRRVMKHTPPAARNTPFRQEV